jgi:hypothetical protein
MSAPKDSDAALLATVEAFRPRPPLFVRFVVLPLLFVAPGLVLGLLAIAPSDESVYGVGLVAFVVLAAAISAICYRGSSRHAPF